MLASSPRFAGSDAESAAREYCAGILRTAGFTVREERFDFSEFPSRWAPALLSLVISVVVMQVGHAAVITHEPLMPMLVAIGVLAAVGLIARYLTRSGVLDFPLSRRSSANLVATPTTHEPALWLVAHVDSKSQTIPMLVRIAAVTVFAIAALAVMVSAAVVALAGNESPDLQHQAAAVAHHASLGVMISALPLILCFIGNRSRGALDNATGVAAVLLAAQKLGGRNSGVLLTSAEELGL
ncbi:MAG TPA: hypothetical protein VFX40_00590, partial [Gemmatimonadaceae bacterium]|nr:hypothetical protein [Gemmatimonadaceae bacterium]